MLISLNIVYAYFQLQLQNWVASEAGLFSSSTFFFKSDEEIETKVKSLAVVYRASNGRAKTHIQSLCLQS